MNYAAFLGNAGTDLTFGRIIMNISLSAVMGLVIYLSYYISHSGTVYSRKFNTSLVALTALTGTVMTVIGNNLALSLGMVGALSIVRFRTAIKDSRDTVYIFWAIIIGICCGVGDYIVAGAGTAVTFLVFLVLGSIRNDDRLLITVCALSRADTDIQSLIFRYFGSRAKLRVRNATEREVEYIFELNERLVAKAKKKGDDIIADLLKISGVTHAKIIAQSEDIAS